MAAMRVLAESQDLETAFEWESEHFGNLSEHLKLELLGEHSERDPKKFVALAASLPNTPNKANLLLTIARNWSRVDPESVVGWIHSIDDPIMQTLLTQSLIPSLQDPRHQQTLAEGLLSKSAYESAIRSIASTRAGADSKEEVVEWIQQLPNAALQRRVTTDLIQSWAYEDPKLATEYTLSELTNDQLTVERLVSIGSIIVGRGDTSIQPWMTTLPEAFREAVSKRLSDE